MHATRLALLLYLVCSPFLAPAALKRGLAEYSWDGEVFILPLTIRDNSGVDRHDWPVTNGIPLPYGVVKDTDALRLTDAQGRDIPAQFTALSRYWARDKSLRWVLLDFQISLPANGKATVYLRNDGPPSAIAAPIKIQENKSTIRVDTGPLQALIPKDRGTLLKSVAIEGLPVIEGSDTDGPWIRSGEVNRFQHFQGNHWNPAGWNKKVTIEPIHLAAVQYSGAIHRPKEAKVEHQGPLRTVVLIKGRYMPLTEGPGIRKEGFYNYTTRLHFYRGKTFIKVEHSIDNSDRKQPQWILMFREASLQHRLTLQSPTTVSGGGWEADQGLPGSGQLSLRPEDTVWLYQSAAQIDKRRRGKPRVEPGTYQIWRSQGDVSMQPAARGRRARYLDISDREKGLTVAMRYFWEQAPRAIVMSPQRLKILLHADSVGQNSASGGRRPEYHLDLGERNLHDILYYFHKATTEGARSAEIAEAFEYPLFAYPSPAWTSDTAVWYFEIDRKPGPPPKKARTSPDRHYEADSFIIQGQRKKPNYNSGGHHESLNSAWLRFMRTGSLYELEKQLTISLWRVGHNPGLAYRDNQLKFGPDSEQLPVLDQELTSWNRLAGFGPKDFYVWASDENKTRKKRNGQIITYPRGGQSYLNKYKWLPDHEHYALFRFFEYYYLSGDRRTLDCIHGFVNWDLSFQHGKLLKGKSLPLSVTDLFEQDPLALVRGHYSRVYTWMLYTNLAGFQATGNAVMDYFARWQLRRLFSLLRDRHGQLTKFRISDYKQHPEIGDVVLSSRTQSWMEAQGPLVLHEAWKVYRDERILDALWAQADYFSHHVLYFPKLTMLNNRTSMPNQLFRYGQGDLTPVTPQRHARHVQAMPILYHYTGWPGILRIYNGIQDKDPNRRLREWFDQAIAWEQESVPKGSTKPPERVTDLTVRRVGRDGITLRWTSPRDDSPSGHAARYFVKYSDKPIVDFAPTDSPARDRTKLRIISEVENAVIGRGDSKKGVARVNKEDFTPESAEVQRHSSQWFKVNAFWMAEHVEGEPEPGPAGSVEEFTITTLHPHNWFGASADPGIETLQPGKYYLALCSWDDDHNLSQVSNIVEVRLP